MVTRTDAKEVTMKVTKKIAEAPIDNVLKHYATNLWRFSEDDGTISTDLMITMFNAIKNANKGKGPKNHLMACKRLLDVGFLDWNLTKDDLTIAPFKIAKELI